MANKFVSSYSQDTTPTGTDKVLIEKASDGVYNYQDRDDLHTLYTGESLDTASGVDLLIKRGSALAMTVASGGLVTHAQLGIFSAGIRSENVAIRSDPGFRQLVAGKGTLYASTEERQVFTLPANGTPWSMIMPDMAAGATTLTLKVKGLTQFFGSLVELTFSVTLLTPTGTTYTETGIVTPTVLGGDISSTLQTALDAAEAAFLSGEGVALTTGDVVYLSVSGGGGSPKVSGLIEIWHT